ncbi:hypothetical protein LTR85_003109 [Meristemomyces frigidus]|nr:hypothetical protein LTR85_003109 [Meristemomyces frigidus]
MASSASKVFAITELLEQILLVESVSMQDLFALQRVNRAFYQIISGSYHLQRRMHLRHLTDGESADARQSKGHWIEGVLNPYLKGLDLHSFGLKFFRVGHLTVHATIQGLSEAQQPFGFHGRDTLHYAPASWARTKLSAAAGPTQVAVDVSYDDEYQRLHVGGYSEIITLHASDATLGNFIGILQEVKARSRLEHDRVGGGGVGRLVRRHFAEQEQEQPGHTTGEQSL